MVFGGAADWARADSAARQRTRKQTGPRMIDTRGIEEAEIYLPPGPGQSVQILTRMVYGWPCSKRLHRSRFAARQAAVLILRQQGPLR